MAARFEQPKRLIRRSQRRLCMVVQSGVPRRGAVRVSSGVDAAAWAGGCGRNGRQCTIGRCGSVRSWAWGWQRRAVGVPVRSCSVPVQALPWQNAAAPWPWHVREDRHALLGAQQRYRVVLRAAACPQPVNSALWQEMRLCCGHKCWARTVQGLGGGINGMKCACMAGLVAMEGGISSCCGPALPVHVCKTCAHCHGGTGAHQHRVHTALCMDTLLSMERCRPGATLAGVCGGTPSVQARFGALPCTLGAPKGGSCCGI